MASPQIPTRKAFDLPQKQPAQGCLREYLRLNAAYTPAQADQALRCSHLLSTDTVVSVRRWDKT